MITGIYVRVSTQEQAEHGYSIDEQQDRLKKYCDVMKWTVYNVYVDAGFSGASMERPALKKLLKDIQAGRLQNVLVYKLDRLSRSQKDTLYLIEDQFLKNGVDFVSMSENFDTSTPLGRAMIGILAVFAQLEREQIKERMSMGKEARAKSGKYHGSNLKPLGYDYVNGELVVNEYEAMQVREMFDLYVHGKTTGQVAEILAAKGYKHKHGEWTRETVKNHLTMPLYPGFIKYKGKLYKGVHEPIVDAEIYEEAQRIRKRRYDDIGNIRVGAVTSYLGGLLTCAHCGAPYYKSPDKNPKYCYYACVTRSHKSASKDKGVVCKNKRWRMEELDNIVLGEIKKLALDPTCSTGVPKNSGENKNDIILSEIEKIEKKIEKLIDLYSVGGIPTDVVQKRISELTEEKEKLEASLEEEEKDIGLAPEEAADIAKNLSGIIENGSFEDVRLIITTLIKKIELDGDNVTIYWNIS